MSLCPPQNLQGQAWNKKLPSALRDKTATRLSNYRLLKSKPKANIDLWNQKQQSILNCHFRSLAED